MRTVPGVQFRPFCSQLGLWDEMVPETDKLCVGRSDSAEVSKEEVDAASGARTSVSLHPGRTGATVKPGFRVFGL